jgi:hypothetical protein
VAAEVLLGDGKEELGETHGRRAAFVARALARDAALSLGALGSGEGRDVRESEQ